MSFIRKTKDIIVFENFITPEESAAAIKVLDKQMEDGKLSWTPISFYESYSSNLPLDNDPDLEEFGHTQKWEPGAYATPHSDNTDIDGNPSPFERSRYAAFLYLNDDFEGGVLRFVKQKLEIEPKVGMLAAFAGGFENIHEVTLITKGVRYTIGSFWDDREESDYPEELRKQWEEEMKKIREQQAVEKSEWQELIKDGYKIAQDGTKYKIEEVLHHGT